MRNENKNQKRQEHVEQKKKRIYGKKIRLHQKQMIHQ